ncbi:MAG: hypothetical protein Roseis2KO_11780 [Roseivirga sp.]
MVKFGTSRRLSKVNKASLVTYLIEIFIVIFGITVAYQLNVYYEDKKDLKLEISAIEKLHTENESNINQFESLIEDRFELAENTTELARILFSGGNLEDDDISHYLFDINKVFKPIIQFEGMNFYLNTNYTNKNSDLKNELISLKNYYLELRDLIQNYVRMKEKYYSEFLVSEVDFGEERIIKFDKIKSVEFKNLVVNLLSNENDLNTLFATAYEKALDVDLLIEEKLGHDD